jgi:hypothetical protein
MDEAKAVKLECENLEQAAGGAGGSFAVVLEVYRGDTLVLKDSRGPDRYDTVSRMRRRVAREFDVPMESVRIYDAGRRELVYEDSLSKNGICIGNTLVAVITD